MAKVGPVAAVALGLVLACGGRNVQPGDDAGIPAPDAGLGADSGRPGDAGTTDAGPGADAGTDAGLVTDAGGDAGVDAGFVWRFDAGPVFGDGGPPLGAPIVADAGMWSWVDFPNSSCDDGSPTGIGVSPSGTSSNLILFFNGGGACWDYLTCYILNTAVHGPYGRAQFFAQAAGLSNGTPFDRTLAQNPFRDWNYVFIPYCTGDTHAGDNVVTYSGGGGSQTYHHTGHANALAFLERIAATFPAPAKLVVSGSSAGGGGAVSNYAFARAYWPAVESYLIDDSLPFFQGNPIPAGEVGAWVTNWNLTPLFTAVCGNCLNDFSLAYPALRQRFPLDRMGLLSNAQDQTISSYYQMSPAQFQTDLFALRDQVLAPQGIQTFFVAGNTHVLLDAPASFTTDAGVNLWPWLGEMVSNDAGWTSAGP